MSRRGPWPGRCRAAPGYSVLEVLVSLSLMAVMMLVGFTLFSGTFKAWLAGRKLADEQQNARVVLEWMTRRLRMAGYGAAAGTSEYFTEAAASELAFLADVDGNGTAELHRFCIDTVPGVVREQIAGGVSSTCTAGGQLTSRGVRPLKIVQLRFAYLDGLQAPLAPLPLTAGQRSAVAWVRIAVVLDSNQSGVYESAEDLAFVADVAVRKD